MKLEPLIYTLMADNKKYLYKKINKISQNTDNMPNVYQVKTKAIGKLNHCSTVYSSHWYYLSWFYTIHPNFTKQTNNTVLVFILHKAINAISDYWMMRHYSWTTFLQCPSLVLTPVLKLDMQYFCRLNVFVYLWCFKTYLFITVKVSLTKGLTVRNTIVNRKNVNVSNYIMLSYLSF